MEYAWNVYGGTFWNEHEIMHPMESPGLSRPRQRQQPKGMAQVWRIAQPRLGHGLSWIMDYRGLSWIVMDYRG